MDIPDLSGVLITHIHGDHVNEWTIGRFVNARVPIFCPPKIEKHLQKKYYGMARAAKEGLLRTIHKSETAVNEFHIHTFEVPHDSDGGCFGYSVSFDAEGKTKKVSVSTDIAHPTESAVSGMADSDVIVLESNYDEDMLEQSGRPAWLKRRIREDGHLSNDQCGDALLQIIDRSQSLPKSLALAHVSRECNTNALALACTQRALDRQGLGGIDIAETHPARPGRTITV